MKYAVLERNKRRKKTFESMLVVSVNSGASIISRQVIMLYRAKYTTTGISGTRDKDPFRERGREGERAQRKGDS